MEPKKIRTFYASIHSSIVGAQRKSINFETEWRLHIIAHLWRGKCVLRQFSITSINHCRGRLHIYTFIPIHLFCSHLHRTVRVVCSTNNTLTSCHSNVLGDWNRNQHCKECMYVSTSNVWCDTGTKMKTAAFEQWVRTLAQRKVGWSNLSRDRPYKS